MFGAAGCSSKKSDDSKGTTTMAPTAGTSGSTGSDATGTTAGDSTATTAAAAGSGKVTLANGAAPADKTVIFSTDGGFDPGTLNVGVGELFSFRAGDSGVHAVRFGTATDTFTISGGLIESFTIDAPGTYAVTEDLSNKTMTVTVK